VKQPHRILAQGLAATAVALACAGCQTLTDVAVQAGAASGVVTHEQAQSIAKGVKAVAKTFEDITPEQEYYIGRSVAATILETYKPCDDKAANDYLNLVGNALACASRKPETFGGYHFQILESDDVNAFAAPGGLIMISRGLLRCCETEDALAAVLAHEIGHVEGAHGLRAIKKGRLTSALTTIAAESGKQLGGEELAQVTEAFEGSIADITSSLMNSGYARSLEREADGAAVRIMLAVGYDPNALVDMLKEMKKSLKPDGIDFAKTHPDPQDRIKDVASLVADAAVAKAPPARQARFEKAMKAVVAR